DVLLDGGKLAGILLERYGDTVIVGIGVNLASAPSVEGRNSVSLADHGPAPDRDLFAADLAASFARELALWRSGGRALGFARWEDVHHARGTALRGHSASVSVVSARFGGLAADGALMLRLADESIGVIHDGDVSRELK